MTKLLLRPLAFACCGASLLLSGCVDDSFDLDNMDETTQIKVNNLTIPLEFSEGIKFDDVVDLEGEELVEVDSRGHYVLLKSGEFESDLIEINEINAMPNVATFVSEPVNISGVAGMKIPFNAEGYARFDFAFSHNDVDAYIRDIRSAEVDFDINLSVSTGIACEFTNLCFRMPAGMTGHVAGNYGDVSEEGSLITFSRVNAPNGEFSFVYHVTALDVQAAGGSFVAKGNGDKGTFSLSNSISLVSGEIEALETRSGELQASFNLGSIRVNSISGGIRYKVDDFSESANLDNLPDLLTDKNTRLGLSNPQLYLRVHNPFGKYGAKASTDITLKQQRADVADFLPESTHSVTTSSPVQVSTAETQTFLLAVSKPDYIYEKYAEAVWDEKYALPGLGHIVYGIGLPDGLDFVFANPLLDSDNVVGFPIGQPVGRVHGDYTFYAPLDFSAGSQIVYSQEQSDWGLENLAVNGLEVAADVNSSIPVEILLTAVPLVKTDNGDLVEADGVEISPVTIPAMASGTSVSLKMTGGEIYNLDGMRYTITLLSASKGNEGALGPENSLDLKNLKITVSGHTTSLKKMMTRNNRRQTNPIK